MKGLLAVALAAGVAVAATTPADARQGCGYASHRGYNGRCVPDRGRVVAVAPRGTLIVGNFYRGRGYWDGRRYYQHRYRWHNGWRYR